MGFIFVMKKSYCLAFSEIYSEYLVLDFSREMELSECHL